jgi:hypothetical protein
MASSTNPVWIRILKAVSEAVGLAEARQLLVGGHLFEKGASQMRGLNRPGTFIQPLTGGVEKFGGARIVRGLQYLVTSQINRRGAGVTIPMVMAPSLKIQNDFDLYQCAQWLKRVGDVVGQTGLF